MSHSEEKTQAVVESKDAIESKVSTSDDNVDANNSANSSSTSGGNPSTAYLNLCAENGAAIRPYLMATLKEIAAEMEGQQRAGVIQLRGSLKVRHHIQSELAVYWWITHSQSVIRIIQALFKSRLQDKDVVCFFSALRECYPSFQAVAINLSCNKFGS